MSDHSPRTIYDLGILLARLEGKVDNILAAEARNDKRHKQHEDRLAKLEKHLFLGLGGIGMLAAMPWAIPLLRTLGKI